MTETLGDVPGIGEMGAAERAMIDGSSLVFVRFNGRILAALLGDFSVFFFDWCFLDMGIQHFADPKVPPCGACNRVQHFVSDTKPSTD